MAVIITNMEMQSACCYNTDKNFEYCKLYDCCKHRETIKVGVKPSSCPLKSVDDMVMEIKEKSVKHYREIDNTTYETISLHVLMPIISKYCGKENKDGSNI